MANKMGRRFYVRGKVQGVWFRASTKTEAEKLQITGFAKNLSDGRVEVVAFGEGASLQALETWLKQGPKLATVLELLSEEMPWESYQGFDIL